MYPEAFQAWRLTAMRELIDLLNLLSADGELTKQEFCDRLDATTQAMIMTLPPNHEFSDPCQPIAILEALKLAVHELAQQRGQQPQETLTHFLKEGLTELFRAAPALVADDINEAERILRSCDRLTKS
ncbi:MAG: hypothetical protein ACTS3T_13865, partial [Almyronema sp.]